MLGRIQRVSKKGLLAADSQFIKRWPTAPKIAIVAPPNAFSEEISQRLAIDLGVPIVSMNQMLHTIS